MNDLAGSLKNICENVPYTVRYSILDKRHGGSFELGANEETPSASTRKISIMLATLKAVHDGRLELDAQIVYEPRLREEVASGIFRYLTPGISLSLRDAIVGMIVLSDNVCTRMVLERLTLQEVNDYCHAVGMTGTHHRFLIPPLRLAADHSLKEVTTTTAADQTRLLDMLCDSRKGSEGAQRLGLTQELCHFALQTLGQQILRYGIPSRLPYDTQFATKGGRGKRGRMDAGIVFRTGEPLYILAVYTDGVPAALADGTPGYTSALETIGRISRVCWDALQ